MNRCNKCGKAVDYSFRYCPTCGGQLYVSLDTPNAKPEMFIDLFNSSYNLLADKNNDSRSKYLPNLSENIIARRGELEYEDDYQDMIRNLGMKFVPPNATTDMYYLSLTNTLAGYTYRSIEELIAKSMKYHEKIFKLLIPSADVTAIVERKREVIEDGTEQDLLFGYIVKLSEFLLKQRKDNKLKGNLKLNA